MKTKKNNSENRAVIFDNGGKTTDRYTVIIDGDVYTMSANALSPSGVQQYAGTTSEIKPPFGKKIKITAAPQDVQTAIREIVKSEEKIENPFFSSGIRAGASYIESKSGRGATIESVDGGTALVRYSDGKTMMAGVDKLKSMIDGGLWVKKLSNPKPKSRKPRKANEKFLAINKRAGEIWKSGKVKQYRDAIKMAAEEMRSGKSAQASKTKKIKNPSTVSGENIDIPVESGLANLAKATVIEWLDHTGKKQTRSLRGMALLSTADGYWMIVAPYAALQNRPVRVPSQAKAMYERFRNYEFDKAQSFVMPLEKPIVPVGHITAIEYDSDKAIYKTDAVRGPKMRAYVHKFVKPSPIYTIKGDRRGMYWIIGKMDKPITERGIEA